MNISKDKKARAHILTKEAKNEVNQESSIRTGDNTKKMKHKHKVNDLKPSEKTSNHMEVRHDAAVELLKFNHESDERIRKEVVTKKKNKLDNGSEKNKSSGKFYDGVSCSENRVIGDGVNKRRKYENKQKKKVKKEKQKEIIDFNFSKNLSTGGKANLKDDIIYRDLMGSDKDQKEQRNKQNYKSRENSFICTDNCILDEAEKQDKKRKMKDYFIESEECENSIKENVKEASVNVYKMISKGDAQEAPSMIRKSKKHKKRENKDNVATCPASTLEAPRKEIGDQINPAVTCNYVENSKSNVMTLNSEKDSKISGSYNSEFKKDTKKSKKKVSFSNEIEEFPLAQSSHKESNSDDLVWGKFSPEEDELIKKAVMDCIEANQLGEQGLHMILNCRKYWKQTRGCWKMITSALPWRGEYNTYIRTHSIFEKSSNCKWEPEESELLKRCYSQHGPAWKEFSDIFGKSRHQVKERYRRIKPENLKRGNWGQDEYQTLFNLVNLDLQLKANQEKKKTHAMLKDNISWESISYKLSTRGPQACCLKWYMQLASSMVNEGLWTDLDDYKMIDEIQKLDPYCFEDVDWDNLLENRSGEICRKRWYEMIRHLDRFWAMPFVEQVDILSQRYCPEMIPYREKNSNIDPAS